MAQQIQVIDRVRARGHPRHQAGHLHLRVRPGLRRDLHMPAHQRMQSGALGQRHHRDQAGPRHEIRIVKARGDLHRIM
jgi:hypothetical protein